GMQDCRIAEGVEQQSKGRQLFLGKRQAERRIVPGIALAEVIKADIAVEHSQRANIIAKLVKLQASDHGSIVCPVISKEFVLIKGSDQFVITMGAMMQEGQ